MPPLNSAVRRQEKRLRTDQDRHRTWAARVTLLYILVCVVASAGYRLYDRLDELDYGASDLDNRLSDLDSRVSDQESEVETLRSDVDDLQ